MGEEQCTRCRDTGHIGEGPDKGKSPCDRCGAVSHREREVTQADRDAAATYLMIDPDSSRPRAKRKEWSGDMRRGVRDNDPLIVAFAAHRIAAEQPLQARIEQLEREKAEAEKKAFNQGYLIAVSTSLHQHDCPVAAEDALRDSGIALQDAASLGLDDFDMKVLRPVFEEMARKDRIDAHTTDSGDTENG